MGPSRVWLTAAFASIGAFMFGFDTGSIGSITVMPQFEVTIGPLSSIVRGLLVSSMLVTSALTGLVAGAISDRFSRVYTISAGAGIFCIGSVISAASPTLSLLFVGRTLGGLGEGLFISLVAVYCVEISPKQIRGRVTSVIQMFVVIGICSGFFTAYGAVHMSGSIAWRSPFIIQSVIALGYSIGCAKFLPFSPRWLHYRGRTDEAEQVLDKLQRAGKEGEKEAFEVMAAEREGKDLHWSELFHHSVRRRTLLACFLQGMQQLSGIDAVLYYAPLIFVQAGISGTTASFLASGGSGLVQVFTTALVLPFMDRIGRRPSTIYGGVLMGGFMVVIASLYTSGAYRTGGKWAIITSIYIFIILFCSTWAMTTRLYASEIQPLRTRAAVSSISTAVNQAINTLVALTIPIFLEKTSSGPYWTFAACLLLTAGVAWLFMPETQSLGLNEIDGAFLKTKATVFHQKAKHLHAEGPARHPFGPAASNAEPSDIELLHRQGSAHTHNIEALTL